MPKLGNDDTLQNYSLSGHYGFSAQRIENLGATEYTLCNIVVDESGSVYQYKKQMEDCIKEIVKACQSSPRADNLMIRLVSFNSDLTEIHGFKLLSMINLNDYDNCLNCGGCTALYDASENAINATNVYGKQLCDNDLNVNGIVIVITDGNDNASISTQQTIKTAFENSVKQESLESLISILVGVNIKDPSLSKLLDNYKKAAGFTQYVSLDDASANTLAKLAAFVSKSISAQSQALGTGGPSKSLSF